MTTVNVKVNQRFYAIMDPQWGSPVVIPETIRASREAAKDAVLWMSEHSLYHGGSHFDERNGVCTGKWAGLAAQGYKVVEFHLTDVRAEVIIGTHDTEELT
jgi:hypothetical protein